MFYKDEKLAVLIDGNLTFNTVRSIELEVDYTKLRDLMAQRGKLLRMCYFSSSWENEEGYSPQRGLLDFLSYNRFKVIEKPTKSYINDDGEKKHKGGSYEVDLTLEAMQLAETVDHIVLFTGSGAFVPLVQRLQEKGIRVSVCSTRKGSSTAVCSDELVRCADNFIDIEQLRDKIGKDSSGVKMAA